MNAFRNSSNQAGETRRDFLKKTAVATAAAAAAPLMPTPLLAQTAAANRVTIALDSSDPLVLEKPVQWALKELERELQARRIEVQIVPGPAEVGTGTKVICVSSRSAALAKAVLGHKGTSIPNEPETWGLVPGNLGNTPVLMATGADVRGLVYGVLELADRVQYGRRGLGELDSGRIESPANRIRSVARLFASDVEDKAWFYDQGFWRDYLSLLVRHRFNRFNLTLGLGYNSPRRVPDSYFYFAYPFLIAVPGYDVRAAGLPEREQARNLEMLRWISDETAARGLHFQLALWTHAYEFVDSPKVNYPITGLSATNHAAYCRDAVRLLIESCPAIGGVTFRAHSESGIPEGSYEFWRTIFDGVGRAGRTVEIDIHSKGIEHKLLDMALATGMPVNVSPKYWAEHMGLPYHQAAIREMEWARPRAGARRTIEAERRFTRYGYADYLRTDRRYGVIFRIWPGTQRLLLWGDPAFAAGYGRYAHFCGSDGLELCEPLSFKGRMGSGIPGRRDGHLGATSISGGGDWRKHAYTYRLWGRLLFDPDTPSASWKRYLDASFGSAAGSVEAALAHASRILPLITTAHLPSASNNAYWPEIYTNMPIVNANRPHPYGDSPSPKRFGTVSSIDPALFQTIDEFAQRCIEGAPSGKYSPVEVAGWLEKLSASAERKLAAAARQVGDSREATYRMWAADIGIQAGIGRFFAQKLRAAVAYSLYERTTKTDALARALRQYREARETWSKMAELARGVYVADLTFGMSQHLRGHWCDRLAAIDADLADMEQEWNQAAARAEGENVLACKVDPWSRAGVRPACQHLPPQTFRRGETLRLDVAVEAGYALSRIHLQYRHVNQADEYQRVDMTGSGLRFSAVIPGTFTDAAFALLYYFEIEDGHGQAWLFPGFNAELSNQPYYVVFPTLS